ncbi:MAG: hypothetical protein K8L97_02150 [Anaerolineae bacterium]|nr:hypothetical protein [Anaerolineae bacterium]
MLEDLLAHYIGIAPKDVQRLLEVQAQSIYEDNQYRQLVDTLDVKALEESLAETHMLLDKHVPGFTAAIVKKYPQVPVTNMTSYSLGNWLVGFLKFPQALNKLLGMHMHIPPQPIREFLPVLLDVFNELPYGGSEWQRALTLLAVPLISEAQPVERVTL